MVAEQVVAFAYQPEKVSTRTQDVVKSVKVLLAQFYCLLKVSKMKKSLEELSPENIQHFTKATKLFAMKQKFLTAALEE